MTTAHATGAGVGTALGAVLVASLKHWAHVDLSEPDAALVGAAMIAAGTGVGHAFVSGGLRGLARAFWRGNAPAA